MTRIETIGSLHAERPRSRLVQASALAGAGIALASWLTTDIGLADLASERRLANLRRFLGELVPYDLRGHVDLAGLLSWAWSRMAEHGAAATLSTLAISLAAIVLAAVFGAAASLPAARNVASASPFVHGPVSGKHKAVLWRAVPAVTRWLLIAMRAIPEYVYAFLLVAVLGGTPWPAVLALAIHNTGILGKLGGETIEDVEPGAPAALRAIGASRLQVAFTAVFPAVLGRFLVYFFVRWESCVREATVLGLLGVVSLGFWIQDARARNHYDEMMFYVLLGAALVLLGDIVSSVARRAVRRAA